MSEKKERGRGAFATRSIKKGDVVVMSPLLYVFRDKLEYSFSDDDHTKVNMTEQVINYCFGHPDSPVLSLAICTGRQPHQSRQRKQQCGVAMGR